MPYLAAIDIWDVHINTWGGGGGSIVLEIFVGRSIKTQPPDAWLVWPNTLFQSWVLLIIVKGLIAVINNCMRN